MIWPKSIQQVASEDGFNQLIAEVLWPGTLQQISFGKHFNQPIIGVVWPSNLQQVASGVDFKPGDSRSCVAGLPAAVDVRVALQRTRRRSCVASSLQQLSLGNDFDQSDDEEIAFNAQIRHPRKKTSSWTVPRSRSPHEAHGTEKGRGI